MKTVMIWFDDGGTLNLEKVKQIEITRKSVIVWVEGSAAPYRIKPNVISKIDIC